MPKFTPKQRAYIRKHSKDPHLDIVVNLIMFLLATTEAVLLISQIESDLPKIAKGRSKSSDVATPLNLNVTVTDGGVIVSGSGGKLAPGCAGIEQGRALTVPKKGNNYDWPGLTECVSRVKQQFK